MTTELLDDIHPGPILLEDFMKPLDISNIDRCTPHHRRQRVRTQGPMLMPDA